MLITQLFVDGNRELTLMSMRIPHPWETVEDTDWLHLSQDEEVRWSGRPSRYTIALAVLGGIALAVLGIVLTLWALPVADDAFVPRWVGYAPLVLTAIGLGVALTTYLNWLRLLYVITDEEIYVKRGLISRDVTQVRLDRVQNTAYNQSILERLLSYGDIYVYTAGTDTDDISFQNVPRPDQVKNTLTELLSEQGQTGNRRESGGI